jgi:hypothetical protein
MSGTAGTYGALLLMGALHGLNPGMGWLLAVARAMQQDERRALRRALLPMALGHALAIICAIGVASVIGLVVPERMLRLAVAVLLVALGIRQLVRHRHPRVGGMRMGARGLVMWYFVIATVHGAGLMTLPLAADAGAIAGASVAHATAAHTTAAHATGVHAAHAMAGSTGPARSATASAVLATLAHTAGYLLVAALLARLVFDLAGLSVLRRAWVNIDLLWALALFATGAGLLALH